jgi:hypothetical protein
LTFGGVQVGLVEGVINVHGIQSNQRGLSILEPVGVTTSLILWDLDSPSGQIQGMKLEQFDE